MIWCWLSSSILVLLVPTVAFESLATFCSYCRLHQPSSIFPSVKPTSTSMSFLPVRYSYPSSCCRWLVLPSPLRYPYLRIACPCPEPSSLTLLQANSIVLLSLWVTLIKQKWSYTALHKQQLQIWKEIPSHIPLMPFLFPQCSSIKSIIWIYTAKGFLNSWFHWCLHNQCEWSICKNIITLFL